MFSFYNTINVICGCAALATFAVIGCTSVTPGPVAPHVGSSDVEGSDAVAMVTAVEASSGHASGTTSCGGVWVKPHVLVTSNEALQHGTVGHASVRDGNGTYAVTGSTAYDRVIVIRTKERGAPVAKLATSGNGRPVNAVGYRTPARGSSFSAETFSPAMLHGSVSSEPVKFSGTDEEFLASFPGVPFCGSAVYDQDGALLGITDRRISGTEIKVAIISASAIQVAVMLDDASLQ